MTTTTTASTVPMVRADGKRADVHPAEEANYSAFGWVRVVAPGQRVEPGAVPEPPTEAAEALVSVFRIVDGERNERASRAELTRAEAEAYVAERPHAEYVILQDED